MTSNDSRYQFEVCNGYAVIGLLPELNQAAWADIEGMGTALVEKISAQKTTVFLVDLSALTYMGSAMVALVVRLWKSVNERDGKLAVVNHNAMVLEVLQLAGLKKVWTIVSSREEGLSALGVSGRKASSQKTGGQEDGSGFLNGRGVIILDVLLLLLAGVGIGLLRNPPLEAVQQAVGLGLLTGGAILGLLTGTVQVIFAQSRRFLGVLTILVALALICLGSVELFNLLNIQ